MILALKFFIKNKDRYCIAVTLILVCLAGLRSSFCGQDTPMYNLIYNDFIGKSLKFLWYYRNRNEDNYEIGYFAVQYIISRIGNYDLFKFICACVQIIPASFIIWKYSKSPHISYLVFFLLPVFSILAMCAMRQGLAFGMCMIAYHYARQQNLSYFCGFVLLAILFHTSAIFFSLVYLANYIKYSKRNNIIVLLLFVVFFVLRRPLFVYLTQFQRLGSSYVAGDEAGGFGMLAFFLLLYGLYYFVDDESKENIDNNFNYYTLVYTILLWFIGLNLAAVFRLAAYTEFFLTLYIANTLKGSKNQIVRDIVPFICFGLYLVWYKLVYNSGVDYPINPYMFLWE